jgi:membrane protein implicated in regulation of membrane protease activity
MSQRPGQLSFVLLAVLASGCAAIVSFVFIFMFGVAADFLGPCPDAPAWWVLLLFIAPPLSALWVGIRVYRKLYRPYR